jgi:hypothetical protein
MWMICGSEYGVGDSVFLARGLLSPKVERFVIIKPKPSRSFFASGYDPYAWASNGKEIVRIDRRGRIADDLFSTRRVIPFDQGWLLEKKQDLEKPVRTFPKISADLEIKLENCISTTGKVRVLLVEGWEERDVIDYLNAKPQMVHEIFLEIKHQ